MLRRLAILFLAAGLGPVCSHAAQPAQPSSLAHVLAVHVQPERADTAFEIELSRPAAFHIATHNDPDRVEIDLAGTDWTAGVPASGTGAGFVSIYRRATSPDGGVRLIIETSTSVKIADSGMGLSIPHQPVTFTLHIRSDDGSLPPVIRLPAGLAETQPVRLPPEKPLQSVAARTSPPREAAESIPMDEMPGEAATTLATPVALAPPPVRPHAQARAAATRRVIAIDPGHGGLDPGTASSEGVFEKSITLATGLVLKNVLESTGRYTVVMTRGDDIFIPLQDRVKIARAAGAELFISLHCDAMESHDAHGATVYTLSQNASDAVSERLAAQENRSAAIGGLNLAREDEGTANLLIDLSMRDSMNQSNRFAELLVREFAQHRIGLQELKPHRSAGFAVLKAADMPSVLIEMGYLSDTADAALLANPGHQRATSLAITDGVDRYFRVPEPAHRS